MEYSKIIKRVLACVLDFTITCFPIIIIETIVFSTIESGGGEGNGSAAILFLISFMVFFTPYFIVFYGLMNGVANGSFDFLINSLVLSLPYIVTLIIAQTLMLTILEIISKDGGIGKKNAGIKIVSIRNEEYTLQAKLCRNLIKSLSINLMPIIILIALFNNKRQTLHDMAAGTVVVNRQKIS